MNISILGAGISGISCAYHLDSDKFNTKIFEAKSSWGGLLDNFVLDDEFIFDQFIHLSFTKNQYVKDTFALGSDSISHNPVAYNLSNGKWIKHPAQFNIKPLELYEKFKILKGFFNRKNNVSPTNYEEWLKFNYGKYFAENYPIKYTKKYWTISPDKLTTDWLATRFKVPKFSEVLKGSIFNIKQNHYYANEMRYPVQGGYKAYLKHMVKDLDIKLNKKVVEIDLNKKKLVFSDGSSEYYEKLISTIPLPELINIIKDIPKNIKDSANKLLATSGQLVSFGMNKFIKNKLWFYIYDEDFYPARAWSPSEKSVNNVPKDKSSIQFETYYSKLKPKILEKDDLINHIIEKSEKYNIFKRDDIQCVDYRELKYANVIFNFDRKINLEKVHSYLKKNNIGYCGRFGEWDYLWSDQSFLSGKKISSKINNFKY